MKMTIEEVLNYIRENHSELVHVTYNRTDNHIALALVFKEKKSRELDIPEFVNSKNLFNKN